MEDLQNSHELDDALAALDDALGRIRGVLADGRALTIDDRTTFARQARQRIANTCAEVDWVLLDRLNTCDRDVISALIDIEPERGAEFRTTGYEIWLRTRKSSQAVVYVALRRLDHLGLIRRVSGRGTEGTRVKLNWGAFSVSEPSAELA